MAATAATVVALVLAQPDAGSLHAGNRSLLRLDSNELATVAGQQVEARSLRVEEVINPTAFWAGTYEKDRVFVELQGPPPFPIAVGQRVSFVGKLQANHQDPANGSVSGTKTLPSFASMATTSTSTPRRSVQGDVNTHQQGGQHPLKQPPDEVTTKRAQQTAPAIRPTTRQPERGASDTCDSWSMLRNVTGLKAFLTGGGCERPRAAARGANVAAGPRRGGASRPLRSRPPGRDASGARSSFGVTYAAGRRRLPASLRTSKANDAASTGQAAAKTWPPERGDA